MSVKYSQCGGRIAIPIEDPILGVAKSVVGLVAGGSQRSNNISLPVVLDQVLKVFAVCWSGIWNVVI
jgi:hypothetical protein